MECYSIILARAPILRLVSLSLSYSFIFNYRSYQAK